MGTGYLMSKDDAYDATHSIDTRIENIAGSLKSLVDDPESGYFNQLVAKLGPEATKKLILALQNSQVKQETK